MVITGSSNAGAAPRAYVRERGVGRCLRGRSWCSEVCDAQQTRPPDRDLGRLSGRSRRRLAVVGCRGPGPGIFASPTVADGSIYVGANNGNFYQLNATTGAVQHKVFVGLRKKLSACSARGFISTATVAPDPVTGVDTVYVGGASTPRPARSSGSAASTTP
ncbi:MAG TPA: PQQ-binding-like beta-propeller repeat protein [Nocardioides sp.]|nr:PQQ-binding-like beta-propeller repeat protein [uncultured Nocardioides sp.]HRD59308.1 PQQ-binding-like beta-propeller repeat protein [Nocardioides sp.]HRI94984.1 PQQ-binding-like beta-propeller repeat protein [Nocardioides sp.]HRK45069.1 PQQ-binding-like beta-propeller repeat protein [Nocardioides sp.]